LSIKILLPDELNIDKLIVIVNQKRNIRGRGLALGVLFFWDEGRAINISMQILKSGRTHPIFQDAMGMLAYRKYEPAYPYLLDMAKQPDGYRNGSAGMLKIFGKQEAIPVLEQMLLHIKGEDPVAQGFLRDTILDAIQSIRREATAARQ